MRATKPVYAMLVVAVALLCVAAVTPKNWGRINWRMDHTEVAKAYPGLSQLDPNWSAWLATERISRATALSNLMARSTKVRFSFDWERKGQLARISFIVPGSFDTVAAELERRFGLPVTGDRREARCFDQTGRRIIEDPSGVGHIIASCAAHATFLDRRHGNAYRIDTPYRWQMEPHGSQAEFGAAQIITITSLANCDECTPGA